MGTIRTTLLGLAAAACLAGSLGATASGAGPRIADPDLVVVEARDPAPLDLFDRTPPALLGDLAVIKVKLTLGGHVTSSPAGIDCPTDCTAAYVRSLSNVTLTATPDSGFTFLGWTGHCTGTGPCSVSRVGDRSIGATFLKRVQLPGNELVVGLAGDGAGTVTSAPAGIDCPADCEEPFPAVVDNEIVLTATPAPGSVFAGWLGDCSGGGACTVSTASDRTVVAVFTLVATPGGAPGGAPDGDPSTPGGTPAGTPGTTPGPALPAGCTIAGTNGDDSLRGTPGRDVICGLGGNDRIAALGGNDRVIGGPGDDLLLGGAGQDRVEGGSGDDVARGGSGADTIVGGKGIDRLYGEGGPDLLLALDRLLDIVSGGGGSDAARVDADDDIVRTVEASR